MACSRVLESLTWVPDQVAVVEAKGKASMQEGGYLRLADLVLAPPLPALVSLAIAGGLGNLGVRLARRLGHEGANARLAGFAGVAAVIGAAVHAYVLVGKPSIIALRVMAAALAVFGLQGAYCVWRKAPGLLAARRTFQSLTRLEKVAVGMVGLIFCALGLLSVAPATDADSFDYHLGLALEWLRSGVQPRPDWHVARLAGVGEALNALGLAAGTDCLGSVLQFAGLIGAAAIVVEAAKDRGGRVLGALLVATTPVVLFLVPNQKPQLLPAAATLAALSLVVSRWHAFDLRAATLAFMALAFAAACKLSFLPSVAIVGLLALVAARRSGTMAGGLAVGLGLGLLLVGPLLGRNLWLYGDPLTPLFEWARPSPDRQVVAFARYLSNQGIVRDAWWFVRLPWHLTFTIRPGELSTVLGAGVLGLALVRPPVRGVDWLPLTAAGLVALLLAAATNLGGRFYMEPYLWSAMGIVGLTVARRRLLVLALTAQGAVVLASAVLGVVLLLPGALTAEGRERVLARFGPDHQLCEWLDRSLPSDARLLSRSRFRACLPRPFRAGDDVEYHGSAGRLEGVIDAIQRGEVNWLVLSEWESSDALRGIAAACGAETIGPIEVPLAVRNPLNTGGHAHVEAVRLEPGTEACRAELASLMGSPAPGRPRRPSP